MKPNACFIVRDRNRQALTYVYYQEEPGRAAMLSALQWLQYATVSSAQQNPGMPMVQKSDQTRQQLADWDGDHGGLCLSRYRQHHQ
jgi:hypothetical protein